MVWTVNWDGHFVVGGDGNRRLTPNFRLKEFHRADGSVRVHRELVSALQMLRLRLGRPIDVVSTDDDGLGATVKASSNAELLDAAARVKTHHLFATIEAGGATTVKARIPAPEHLPAIELEQALETAFSVTSAFETSGDRFQQITGNFDGAGLSFGPAQWNFKTDTLVPLFRLFENADAAALEACFTDPVDFEEWQQVLARPIPEQIEWADDISTGRGKHEVAEPWRSYFRAVGSVPRFRQIMVEEALRKYGRRLLDAIDTLQGLVPGVRIDHLRCVCSLYDLVIQQGSLSRAMESIERRVKDEQPRDQFALVGIAVEERGRAANAPWRADCVSRRLGILRGFPQTIDGHQRVNLNFYMLRDVHVAAAVDPKSGDVDVELARVATAIAAGDSLLA